MTHITAGKPAVNHYPADTQPQGVKLTFFAFWLCCAILSAIIASAKGRNGGGWFLLGCLFGLFAVIAVAAMPRIEVAPPKVAEKKCPRCAEMVKAEAVVCRFCGADLSDKTIADHSATEPSA